MPLQFVTAAKIALAAVDPEEAKQIAKCMVAALTDAGLEIVPVSRNSCDG